MIVTQMKKKEKKLSNSFVDCLFQCEISFNFCFYLDYHCQALHCCTNTVPPAL